MVICYVLINVAPAHERSVYNKLTKVHEITELRVVFGEYDIIVKIEVDDFEKLGNIVLNKIRTIDGVINTKTLVETGF